MRLIATVGTLQTLLTFLSGIVSLGSGLAFLSRLSLYFYHRFLHRHALRLGIHAKERYEELMERESARRHLSELKRKARKLGLGRQRSGGTTSAGNDNSDSSATADEASAMAIGTATAMGAMPREARRESSLVSHLDSIWTHLDQLLENMPGREASRGRSSGSHGGGQGGGQGRRGAQHGGSLRRFSDWLREPSDGSANPFHRLQEEASESAWSPDRPDADDTVAARQASPAGSRREGHRPEYAFAPAPSAAGVLFSSGGGSHRKAHGTASRHVRAGRHGADFATPPPGAGGVAEAHAPPTPHPAGNTPQLTPSAQPLRSDGAARTGPGRQPSRFPSERKLRRSSTWGGRTGVAIAAQARKDVAAGLGFEGGGYSNPFEGFNGGGGGGGASAEPRLSNPFDEHGRFGQSTFEQTLLSALGTAGGGDAEPAPFAEAGVAAAAAHQNLKGSPRPPQVAAAPSPLRRQASLPGSFFASGVPPHQPRLRSPLGVRRTQGTAISPVVGGHIAEDAAAVPHSAPAAAILRRFSHDADDDDADDDEGDKESTSRRVRSRTEEDEAFDDDEDDYDDDDEAPHPPSAPVLDLTLAFVGSLGGPSLAAVDSISSEMTDYQASNVAASRSSSSCQHGAPTPSALPVPASTSTRRTPSQFSAGAVPPSLHLQQQMTDGTDDLQPLSTPPATPQSPTSTN